MVEQGGQGRTGQQGAGQDSKAWDDIDRVRQDREEQCRALHGRVG